jgi:hypothetical protein
MIGLLAISSCAIPTEPKLLSREQAIDIAARELRDPMYDLDAVLHQPSRDGKIPSVLLTPDCTPDLPLAELQSSPVWRVDAKLNYRGPGVRGTNLRYLIGASTGKVLTTCRL